MLKAKLVVLLALLGMAQAVFGQQRIPAEIQRLLDHLTPHIKKASYGCGIEKLEVLEANVFYRLSGFADYRISAYVYRDGIKNPAEVINIKFYTDNEGDVHMQELG